MIEKKMPSMSSGQNSDKAAGPDDRIGSSGAPPADDLEPRGFMEGDGADLDLDGTDDDASKVMARQQKMRNTLMTYGIGAAFFGVVILLTYPHFKHYFVTEQSTQQPGGIAVPDAARSSHFKLGSDMASPSANSLPSLATNATTENADLSSGKALPAPPVNPAGAMSADIAAIPPAANDASSSPSQAAPTNEADTQTTNPVANGSAPATQTNPAVAAPESSTSVAEDAKLSDLAQRLSSLQSTIDTLSASKQQMADDMNQMSAKLESLQKQVADLAAVRADQAAPRPARQVSRSRPVTATSAPVPAIAASNRPAVWVLRSAMPGMALIGREGSSDLQKVAIGDVVSGLGRITSIEEQSGRWVVQGTNGSVAQ